MISRKILGWSDKEFWESTPRKYLAVYFTYLELQGRINNAKDAKPLLGKEAVNSLRSIVQSIS